jgi:hypothetical protein
MSGPMRIEANSPKYREHQEDQLVTGLARPLLTYSVEADFAPWPKNKYFEKGETNK